MQYTPEEPFSRQDDPEYVDMVRSVLEEKKHEVFDGGAGREEQLREFKVLRFAAQAVINPHDAVALDEWRFAEFKLNSYRRAHPTPPLEIRREDG